MLLEPLTDAASSETLDKVVDYDQLAATFNDTLVSTLRGHSASEGFLDLWVPDADPVLGIAGMVDSARIAGLDSIAIQFRRTTIPDQRHHELKQLLGASYTMSLEARGDVVVLHARNLKQAPRMEVVAPQDRKPRHQVAAMARVAPADLGHQARRSWDGVADVDVLPEFSDAHPHFRPGLAAALAGLSREGDIGPTEGSLIYVRGSEAAATLSLAVDPETHVVRKARHTGASRPAERAVLDLFCKAAEGVPVQEVADHLALKVLASLVDQDRASPVPGVLLPINAGAPFTLPARLARQAFDAYRADTGWGQETNFYIQPPPKTWQALSPEERLEKLDYVLRAFLQSEGLYPDDMSILRLQRNKYGHEVRANIGFSDRVAVADKPKLMRRLEQRMRRDMKTEIDLVADRARDTSPLRRLS